MKRVSFVVSCETLTHYLHADILVCYNLLAKTKCRIMYSTKRKGPAAANG